MTDVLLEYEEKLAARSLATPRCELRDGRGFACARMAGHAGAHKYFRVLDPPGALSGRRCTVMTMAMSYGKAGRCALQRGHELTYHLSDDQLYGVGELARAAALKEVE